MNELEKSEKEALEGELSELGEKMHCFRFKKVLLDADAAAFFKISTNQLKNIVKRNMDKFPEEFMFKLVVPERCLFARQHYDALQKGTGKNIKYLPMTFTIKGFAMLASVLRTKKALQTQLYLLQHCIHLELLPIIAF